MRVTTSIWSRAAAAWGLAGLAALGCQPQSSLPPALTPDTLGALQMTFNDGADGPRLFVFFSSGCASCDTGSARLQAMLETLPGPLTVFAVWEPVQDGAPPPTAEMLDNLTDSRIQQLWDPDHLISAALRAAELAHPGSPPQAHLRTDKDPDGILYDTLVLFEAGERWEATLPAPSYLDGGLFRVLEDVRDRLAHELEA